MPKNAIRFPDEARLKQLFGERFTLALEALDIRPSEAAEMLGVSQSRLTHWMKGRHFADTYRLAYFCAATGVTMDFLLLGNFAALPHSLAGPIMARLGPPPEPSHLTEP